MTGKQIVEKAFNQEKTPRAPVTLIGGGAWYVNMLDMTYAQIKNDPPKIAQYSIEGVKRFGHELLWSGSGLLNYPYSLLGCPIVDDSANPPALEGAVIDSLDQMDSLDQGKVLSDSLMQGIISSHHLVADAIGSDTMVLPTQWGPFTGASRVLGADNFMMSTATDPEKLKELISFCTELIWALAEQKMDHPGVAGINVAEPVASGDMVSPDTFRELVAPYIKELAERTKAKGKYFMLHICGDTTGILEDVAQLAPHCYSLEAKVDLAQAKEILGGKVCVAGQVSPIGPFLNGSPEEVKAEAQACLDIWGDDPGFMLTLGCDFPAHVPVENIEALMSYKD